MESALPSLLAFLLAASLLTITPGVDTAMVLRTAAVGGARPASFAGLGIVLGCLIWGLFVAVGLGALIAASPLAFQLLQWLGAAYLLWLGTGLLLRPRAGLAVDDRVVVTSATEALRNGFLTNMLNPKVGIFYVSFLPQFAPDGVSSGPYIFLLAAIHGLLGLIWFALLIAATVPLRRTLERPRVLAALDRITGIVFVGFGLKLALTRA